MAVDYKRTFTHRDWVDNVDRVQAGGDNGFNSRFHGLEAEFDTLALVVRDVGTTLEQIGATPPPREVTFSTVPTLVATAGAAWQHAIGSVSKPGGSNAAQGMMPLTFPDRVTLKEFRVFGNNSGAGGFRIELRRQSASEITQPDTIAQVVGAGVPFANPTGLASPQFAKVDNARFGYYVFANVTNAGSGDQVNIFSIQVVWVTA